ncbi:MAG: ribonuclease Y [Planctomycetes bacterium]|nr:ribonuclease Y [Planctomycetota bacterium]
MDSVWAFGGGAAVTLLCGGGGMVLWLLPALRARLRRELGELLRREAEVAAKEQLYRDREALARQTEEGRAEIKELEDRCRVREDALDRRAEALEERERALSAQEAVLKTAQAQLAVREGEVARTEAKHLRELERVSELRREEAEHVLLERVERELAEETEVLIGRAEAELREGIEHRARDLLLTAVQRSSLAHVRDSMVSVVPLPNDELKGLLIGRDGRNVRTFEEQAGVDLLIDDTPGVVVVSGFDPVRREVARRALTRLIEEGRIHPPRIEAVIAETRQDLEAAVEDYGRQACVQLGLPLQGRVVTQLGRLQFVSAGGQNALQHAVEVGQLTGGLAAELGLDADLARRCGLLHDLGKGVAATSGQSAASAGAQLAARLGEDPIVVNAIAAATGEAEPSSPYAVLVHVANRISAERPGARQGQLEVAIRRRAELENLALRHAGVRKALAVQAGRELRVIVDPYKVSDKAAQKLAREIARELEQAPAGPGPVKVSVIRELRHEEFVS